MMMDHMIPQMHMRSTKQTLATTATDALAWSAMSPSSSSRGCGATTSVAFVEVVVLVVAVRVVLVVVRVALVRVRVAEVLVADDDVVVVEESVVDEPVLLVVDVVVVVDVVEIVQRPHVLSHQPLLTQPGQNRSLHKTALSSHSRSPQWFTE